MGTGKNWRWSLYAPSLHSYPPEAVAQTLPLWAESLSHLTTLQKASVPTVLVPWRGAARILASQRAAVLGFVVQVWAVTGTAVGETNQADSLV